jgi:hypothetical protein
MRLVAGTLAVLLSPSLAFAEDAAPARVESVESRYEDASARPRAKVPLRVVRILRETGQALVFDRSAGTGGTHLLVGVGEKVAGYTVESIDDDEVTLSAGGRQIVLAAPDQSWRRRRGGRGGEARDAARPVRGEPAPADPYEAVIDEKAPVDPYAKPEASAPVDPYAKPAGSAEGSAPVDPYGEESRPLREVKAPSSAQPGGEAVRSTSAGGAGTGAGGPVGVPVVIGPSAPPPAPVVIGPSAPAPAPVVIGPSAPAPVVTPPAMIGPSPGPAADPVLARREVDAALADFGALAVGFQAAFTPAGVKVESVLAGSLFAKAGLRAGDVIESVDGRPLRSLDDVAALYARAQALRVVTAQVVRGGKPVALRVTIQ